MKTFELNEKEYATYLSLKELGYLLAAQRKIPDGSPFEHFFAAIELFKNARLATNSSEYGIGPELIKSLQFESNLYNSSDFYRNENFHDSRAR